MLRRLLVIALGTLIGGYALTRLAHAQEYPASVTIENPSATAWTWGPFPPGTHRFVVTAFNAAGVESPRSNEATKSCATVCYVPLSWVAPTENTDGTPLTNLAGFRLYATAPTTTQPAAPTSLTVGPEDLTVYTIVQSRNRVALVAVGTAAPGTACDPSQSVLGKYVVPIEAVTLAGSVRPVVVLGTCS